MKSILFIHHGMHAGGAERSFCDLIHGLATKNTYLCHLIAPEGVLTERASTSCQTKPMRLMRFKKTINPFTLIAYTVNYIAVSIQIYKYCRQVHIELIYANSINALLYTLLTRKLLKLKLILHLRDQIPGRVFSDIIKKNCDKVICISRYIESFLSDQLPANRRCVVYNGIYPADFHVSCRSHGSTVGYAGQFVPWKRIELLINAMSLVTQEIPEAQLLIAGRDHYNDHPVYREELQELVTSLHLQKSIKFAGWHNDINTFFNQIDILALPSEGEPFGRIIIEAMAAGVPVVGVDSGAIPEIIEHKKSGLLCASTPTSMGESIMHFLRSDKLRTSCIKYAQKTVSDHFRTQNVTDIIHQIIMDV